MAFPVLTGEAKILRVESSESMRQGQAGAAETRLQQAVSSTRRLFRLQLRE